MKKSFTLILSLLFVFTFVYFTTGQFVYNISAIFVATLFFYVYNPTDFKLNQPETFNELQSLFAEMQEEIEN